MSEDERVEPVEVKVRNWPDHDGPGGWVVPGDSPVDYWIITAIHERYYAPAIKGGPRSRLWPLESFLVDLEGKYFVPNLRRVLLYQTPHLHWMVREVDADYLAKIEEFRLTGDA